MNKRYKIVILGAGARGDNFATLLTSTSLVEDIDLVGVIEILETRRLAFAQRYNITSDMVFSDYHEFFSLDKSADAVIISNQDSGHFEPAKLAIEKGYHVLLEKPMSNDIKECIELKRLAETHSTQLLAVTHVLRYTPFFNCLKQVVDSGEIGNIVSINHNENIGFYHFAHSYVRGCWRSKKDSSPLILAKSCHDLDILLWLTNTHCTSISAFGGLSHFNKSSAPKGHSARCLDCNVEADCAYSAKKIYMEDHPNWLFRIENMDLSPENVHDALAHGPYGRCVYECDNDVLDHMSISMQFEDKLSAVFSLSAFTNEISRTIKIMGTKGEIRGHFEKNLVEINIFGKNESRIIRPKELDFGGHGGGDMGLMYDFCNSLKLGHTSIKSEFNQSIESHLLAFAAEQSYESNIQIHMKEFCLEHNYDLF